MNIEYLREFIGLANTLSFTVAAQSLNITQPALSKHIIALEKEFGIDLLDRNKKGIQLTEAGRSLYESAEQIVGAYDEAKSNLEDLKTKHPINVVGHLNDSDISALASMVSMIVRQNHQIALVFNRNPVQDPVEALAQDDVDLFLGYANPEEMMEQGFACKPFCSNRLVAIVGNEHPFANRRSIPWDELKSETLLKFISDTTNPAWAQIEELCLKHGFTPKTRAVSSLNDVEFFSTPLKGSVLVWKRTQKQIGLILETGKRASIPFEDEDANLVAYALYRPEKEEYLKEFFEAVNESHELLDNRRKRNFGE